jgi:succinoglycan biosynthesis transport protein ExoP
LGLLTGLCLCLCIDRFDERIRDLDQIGVARGTGRLPPLPIAERGPAADSPPAFAAVDQPFSAFGDALRAVKSKLDASVDAGQKKCIGVMPVTAGAGASTVAVNLAALHARAGLRVLLVDMNFARPSLTRLLAPQAENGLLEFIYESRDCAIRNDRYGFTFVPLVDCANIANPANVFGSQAMSLMLGAAKTEFDLVILDLQSSPEILDGKAAAPILDRIIFAAEYRKTRIGDLLSAIQHAGRLPNEVVLNKCGHPEFGVLIAEALRRAVEAWSSLRWVVDAAMQRVRRWS